MATSMSNLAQMISQLTTSPGLAGGIQKGREMRRAEEDRQLARQKLMQDIEKSQLGLDPDRIALEDEYRAEQLRNLQAETALQQKQATQQPGQDYNLQKVDVNGYIGWVDPRNPNAPPVLQRDAQGNPVPYSDPSKVQVNVDLERETEFEKQRSKNIFENVYSAGRIAESTLPHIEQAYMMLDQGALETGALAPLQKVLGAYATATMGERAAEALGIGNVANKEQFNALTQNLALNAVQKLPGQASDKDVKFIQGTVANLQNTTEANKVLLRGAKMAAWNDKFLYNIHQADEENRFKNARPIATKLSATPKVGQDNSGRIVYLNEYLQSMKEWQEANGMKVDDTDPKWINKALDEWSKRYARH